MKPVKPAPLLNIFVDLKVHYVQQHCYYFDLDRYKRRIDLFFTICKQKTRGCELSGSPQHNLQQRCFLPLPPLGGGVRPSNRQMDGVALTIIGLNIH